MIEQLDLNAIAQDVMSAVQTWGIPFLAGIAIAFILLIVFKIVTWARDRTRYGIIGKPIGYDSTRLFSADQKEIGYSRAGWRCEYERPGILHLRCKESATHADHYFAYSRGGRTSLRNFVAACGAHNLEKGSSMQSRSQRKRMARRRKRYFPAGMELIPGEWTSRIPSEE